MGACFQLSASVHTRKAYWSDARKWLAFCEGYGVNPVTATPLVVAAWMEDMKRNGRAPKTIARRIAGLSSIYDRLRRDNKLPRQASGDPPINPFSVRDGPKRERTPRPRKPTPLVSLQALRAALADCDDDTPEGLRDAALIRLLWATGARRSTVVAMTFEGLRREQDDYLTSLPAKGGKTVRLLITGHASSALTAWLAWLRAAGIAHGSIWRSSNGSTLVERDIWKIVRRRGDGAGFPGALTPHAFRATFLTINPSSLASKQDAAGHSDPATTRQYDRIWRGREAFEAMPEIEDVDGFDA